MSNLLEIIIWVMLYAFIFKWVANCLLDWFINPIREWLGKTPLAKFGKKKD